MTKYNKTFSKAAAACLTAAAMLAACAQDDTMADGGSGNHLTLPGGSNGIIISGSGSGSTRAFTAPNNQESGPQQEGICRADAIDVMVFTEGRRYIDSWPQNISDLKLYKAFNPAVQIIGNDRYASCTEPIECASDAAVPCTYVLSTALAYNSADKNTTFETAPTDRTEISLKLIAGTDGSCKTPELFYGIVRGKGDRDIKENQGNFPDGVWWETDDTKDITFYGRIYRIVSQININIKELPIMAVERIELYGDNYPTEMNLYGSHGTHYPVSPASTTTGQYDDSQLTDEEKEKWAESPNFVLLDAQDIAEDQTEVTLSTFLLPSEEGMRLRMRVIYRPATELAEQSDEEKEYKDFNIRPAESHFITGSDAATYSVSDEIKDQEGNLYVYDNRDGHLCFYSYANVRVNIGGKFEDIAGESSNANITIEVIPGFEHGPYNGGEINGGFSEEHEIQLK